MYEESGESLGLSVISRGSRQESNAYLVESGNIVRGNAVPAELFKALYTCKARQTPVADSGHFLWRKRTHHKSASTRSASMK